MAQVAILTHLKATWRCQRIRAEQRNVTAAAAAPFCADGKPDEAVSDFIHSQVVAGVFGLWMIWGSCENLRHRARRPLKSHGVFDLRLWLGRRSRALGRLLFIPVVLLLFLSPQREIGELLQQESNAIFKVYVCVFVCLCVTFNHHKTLLRWTWRELCLIGSWNTVPCLWPENTVARVEDIRYRVKMCTPVFSLCCRGAKQCWHGFI